MGRPSESSNESFLMTDDSVFRRAYSEDGKSGYAGKDEYV